MPCAPSGSNTNRIRSRKEEEEEEEEDDDDEEDLRLWLIHVSMFYLIFPKPY
jgi:hypothetical protein